METLKNNTEEQEVMDGITENWKFLAKQLQAKFPQLTDADLKLETNQEEELINRIELKLDKSRKDVISIIELIQYEDFLIRTEV